MSVVKTGVISCFFSTSNFKRPVENHKIFAARLKKQGIPLLTIELAFNDNPFQLQGDVVQLRSQSILWQKERLLNHAVSLVDWPNIIWSDADLIFNDGWIEKVEEALSLMHIVQCFRYAYRLFPEQKEFSPRDPDGNQLWQDLSVMAGGNNIGFAWAARRDFLRNVGLYDRAILGSGDWILLNAIMQKEQPKYLQAVHDDIDEWQKEFIKYSPKVGYANNRCCHLWHGELKNRRYSDRHHILVKHNYNPCKDIRKQNHVWEWMGGKPDFYRDVKDYFAGRKEDG
jgi:hypothetical protein